MDQETLQKIKRTLEKEKIRIKKQLLSFAQEDKKLKGDWDTLFPVSSGESGTEDLQEDMAKRREEYEALLPAEFVLEIKLRNIEKALEKIERGAYGICENCQKPIPKERLFSIPETPFCFECELIEEKKRREKKE